MSHRRYSCDPSPLPMNSIFLLAICTLELDWRQQYAFIAGSWLQQLIPEWSTLPLEHTALKLNVLIYWISPSKWCNNFTYIHIHVEAFYANRDILIMSSYADFVLPTCRQTTIWMYWVCSLMAENWSINAIHETGDKRGVVLVLLCCCLFIKALVHCCIQSSSVGMAKWT